MNYDEQEHEYTELKAQFHQEKMLEPTSPYSGGFLLVDDNGIEEPIGFRSIDGAVTYASDYWSEQTINEVKIEPDYTVYQLKKIL